MIEDLVAQGIGFVLMLVGAAILIARMQDRCDRLRRELAHQRHRAEALAASLRELENRGALLCIGCEKDLGIIVDVPTGARMPMLVEVPAPPKVVPLPTARARRIRKMLRWS